MFQNHLYKAESRPDDQVPVGTVPKPDERKATGRRPNPAARRRQVHQISTIVIQQRAENVQFQKGVEALVEMAPHFRIVGDARHADGRRRWRQTVHRGEQGVEAKDDHVFHVEKLADHVAHGAHGCQVQPTHNLKIFKVCFKCLLLMIRIVVEN